MPRPKRKIKEANSTEETPQIMDEPPKQKRKPKVTKPQILEEEEEVAQDADEMEDEEEGSSGSNSGKDPEDKTASSTNQNKVPPDNLYIWKCGYCSSWSATTSIISEHAKIVHSAKAKYVVYLRDRLTELCDDKVLEESGEIYSGAQGGSLATLKDTVVLPFSVKPESDFDEEQPDPMSENSSEPAGEASNGPAETVSVKPEPDDNSYEVYVNTDGVKEKDEKPKIGEIMDQNLSSTFPKAEPATNDTNASGEPVAKPIDADSSIKQE